MIVIIVFVLFTFSLGDDVHPQDSRQCVMDRDVHELMMKMKCELVNMKEELRAFKKNVTEELLEVKSQWKQLPQVCRETLPNCLECDHQQGDIVCTRCNEGYFVENGTMCKACRHELENCENCGIFSDNGSSSLMCTACDKGYFFSDNGNCSSCQHSIPKCTDCTADRVTAKILCSQCDNGFTPSTTNRSCNAISCGVPPDSPRRGGNTYFGMQYGDMVTYYCDDAYYIHGAHTRTCDSTGKWGHPPCCIRKLSGVTTTMQWFDWKKLNDENIRVYLQNHLDTHVGTLSLEDNQLTDLSWISDFPQLDTLKVLYVTGNRIKSFSWDDIPPLTEEIYLYDNNLVSLPHIGKHNTCVHVKTLSLDSNQLENMQCSHIPHTVVTLYLHNNKLKTLCNMSHLQLTYLSLYDNQLENMECSHIPHTVVTLYLQYNKLKTLCDMSHLQLTELSLSYNQLENIECSHIPHTVVTLWLSHNKLKTLCNMSLFTQLRRLYLHNNQLTTVSADHLPPSLQIIYLLNNLFDCVNIRQSLSVSVNC